MSETQSDRLRQRLNPEAPAASSGVLPARQKRKDIAAILFFGVIALAPLPFGSIDAVVLSVWCFTLSVALLLLADSNLKASQAWMLALIGVAAALVVATIGLQLGAARSLPPDPIWRRAADALQSDLRPIPAIARNLPLYSLGNLIACGLACSVGIILGASRRRVRQGLAIFVCSSALYAVYGIVSALTEPTLLLGTRRSAYDGDVIGTFVQRNTAAVYFAAGAAISTLLFLRRSVRALPVNRRTPGRIIAQASSRFDLPLFAYFLAAVASVSAVLLSGSRAGFILLLAVMALLFSDAVGRIRYVKPLLRWSLVALVLFLVLRLSAPSLDARFADSGFDDEGRLAIQAAASTLAADHPILGVGAGLFPLAFPLVRPVPPDIWGTYARAFNVPLETAVELGLPVTLYLCLLFCAAGISIWRAAPGASPLVRRAGTALLLISGAHALFDYSLEIPGFAIVVSGLMGLILASVRRNTPDARLTENETSAGSWGLARFPTRWNHLVDQKSRQLNELSKSSSPNRFPLRRDLL